MSAHDRIRELLPLAAAGATTPDEQRLVEEHVPQCAGCARELDEWRLLGEAIADAPPPPPPEMLVERTRNRIAAQEASRRERRVSDVILGFVILFGWTVSLAGWLLWRLMTGGPLLALSWRGAAFWLGGSTLFAWLTAGVAVVLLVSKRELMRRYL